MAKTICFYCDRTYLEQYSNCPYCKEKQVDMVVHAHLLAGKLRSEKLQKDEKLIKDLVFEPIVKGSW